MEDSVAYFLYSKNILNGNPLDNWYLNTYRVCMMEKILALLLDVFIPCQLALLFSLIMAPCGILQDLLFCSAVFANTLHAVEQKDIPIPIIFSLVLNYG